MKKSAYNLFRHFWMAVLLALGFGGGARAASDSTTVVAPVSLAMVTDMKGGVALLTPPGRRIPPVSILTELAAGAELKLDAGASLALVYVKSGSEYRATGPGTLTIGAEEPSVAGAAALARRDSLLTAHGSKLETRGGRVIQGAIRMRDSSSGALVLAGPMDDVLQQRPVFSWKGGPPGSQLDFELSDDESGKSLIKARVKGGSYALPARLSLTRGKQYTWTLDLADPAGRRVSLTASFRIASEEQARPLLQLQPKKGASFSDRVIYALMLQQAGFRSDAAGVWKSLADERPEQGTLLDMAGR